MPLMIWMLQVIHMIRDDILPFAVSMPKDFVKRVMQLLNRGSIHATSSDSFIGLAFSTPEKKALRCFIHRPGSFLGSKSFSALSKTLICFINEADTFIRSKSFGTLEPKPQVCFIHRANTFLFLLPDQMIRGILSYLFVCLLSTLTFAITFELTKR